MMRDLIDDNTLKRYGRRVHEATSLVRNRERKNLRGAIWNMAALTISASYVSISGLCLVQVLLSQCF